MINDTCFCWLSDRRYSLCDIVLYICIIHNCYIKYILGNVIETSKTIELKQINILYHTYEGQL